MIDNNNSNYYDKDRNKIEKANRKEELKSIEKGILDQSDTLTSTVILWNKIDQ
ncbi:MAG: hypothetical protein ACREVX_04650 [Clostridium sp.]|uniref:hypothetical protein n=1 Tax=Clostridium sp. TaxID=1506 RepID=UPI003D6DA4C3